MENFIGGTQWYTDGTDLICMFVYLCEFQTLNWFNLLVGEGPLFADPIVSAGEPFCKRVWEWLRTFFYAVFSQSTAIRIV